MLPFYNEFQSARAYIIVLSMLAKKLQLFLSFLFFFFGGGGGGGQRRGDWVGSGVG